LGSGTEVERTRKGPIPIYIVGRVAIAADIDCYVTIVRRIGLLNEEYCHIGHIADPFKRFTQGSPISDVDIGREDRGVIAELWTRKPWVDKVIIGIWRPVILSKGKTTEDQ